MDRDTRVKQLNKQPKAALITILLRPKYGMLMSRSDLNRWTKDEILNEIIRVEYPDRTTAK